MHNCGTCDYGIRCFHGCPQPSIMHRHDTGPQHMHPCEHGTPVVASAVAGVRFYELPFVRAYHTCKDGAIVSAGERDHNGTWRRYWRYCCNCGLRLPTSDELAQMYEAWKAAEAKEGQNNAADD